MPPENTTTEEVKTEPTEAAVEAATIPVESAPKEPEPVPEMEVQNSVPPADAESSGVPDEPFDDAQGKQPLEAPSGPVGATGEGVSNGEVQVSAPETEPMHENQAGAQVQEAMSSPSPSPEATADQREASAGNVEIQPFDSAQGKVASKRDLWQRFLDKLTGRKAKRLQKIIDFLTLRQAQGKFQGLTNDDVEKLLRVSDSTAARYLGELVKAGKLERVGATSGSVYRLRVGIGSNTSI